MSNSNQNAQAQGFGMIPNWLVRESDLSAYALLTYIALSGRANANSECWPSLKTIAKEARCSESTARRSIKELRDLGIVTVARRTRRSDGGQTSNIYRVLVGVTRKPGVRFTPSNDPLPPMSGGHPAPATQEGQEEYPCEQDSNTKLKFTLPSEREHSETITASESQITFLTDCHIILHGELPELSDYGRWERISSAVAHSDIRLYWSEIEQGADHLLEDAMTLHRDHLSPKAISYINKRVA